MSNLYRKIIALALPLIFAAGAQAQVVEYLSANNVSAGIPTAGNLFYQADSVPQNFPEDTFFSMVEIPKGSSIKNSYSSSMWLSAEDAGGNLHCSAQNYWQCDFFDGPIASTYGQAYNDYYKRVFKITRTQVNAHLQLSFPVSILQVDNALRMWPAKGNPYVATYHAVNISSPLAPFVDVNGDGIYDPIVGDYPDFCGEEAVFFVFNDVNGPQYDSTGAALGIEVRGLAEVFVDNAAGIPYEKNAINNTVFVKYDIENKSSANYDNFLVGRMHHSDLGCYSNDYVGCDTTQNLMFSYNGQADIDCQGAVGFNSYKAALGVKFLNNRLAEFSHTGDFSVKGYPTNANEYRNHMQGKWRDGSAFTYGGNGQADTGIAVKHVYPGNPNDTLQWSEINTQTGFPNSPGDRKMQGAIDATSFAPGEVKHFDMAVFVSYDSLGNGLTRTTIVDTLKRDADIVQVFYVNSILPCRASQQPVGIAEAVELLNIKLFPNPANNVISIKSDKMISSIVLTDAAGSIMIATEVNSSATTIDVSKLAKGIYMLQLKAGTGIATKKVVVN